MTKHAIAIALAGLLAYGFMEWEESTSWPAIAAQHGGCHVVEDREGNRWASVGLNGHPRIGASEGREKWICIDGTIHWRNKI